MPSSQTLLFPDPRPLVERLGADFFRQLPRRPGVYFMHDAAGGVLYVGKAKNLRQRLGSYRVANPDRLGRRHLRLLRSVERIAWQECVDEAAALAKEAELLRALKPKFNRAGVWPASTRFLNWRCQETTLQMAITDMAMDDWHSFGPFGGSIIYLRRALARLLWLGLNPSSGVASLPSGWIHGQMGTTVALDYGQKSEPDELRLLLEKLFAGDAAAFEQWTAGRTETLVRTYDLELRDADLETVIHFAPAAAKRNSSIITHANNVAASA